MKKFFCLTIAFILLTGLTACDNTIVDASSADASGASSVSEESSSEQVSSEQAGVSSCEPSELTYKEIRCNDSEYGKTGVFLSYDEKYDDEGGTLYAFIEEWNEYFTLLPGFHIPEDLFGYAFGASLNGDTAWITFVDPSASNTVKTFRLTCGSEAVETYSFDTGADLNAVFGVYASFYGENSGSLFIAGDDYEWQLTVLKTNDGGKTWSIIENGDVLKSNEHEWPLTAKFVSDNAGIVAYRYYGEGDFRTRTFITTDGGGSWALLSGLDNPFTGDDCYTEVVDFALSDNMYTVTVRANGDGLEESIVHFRSSDFIAWVTDLQP